jgi:hypothetical protein
MDIAPVVQKVKITQEMWFDNIIIITLNCIREWGYTNRENIIMPITRGGVCEITYDL